ncbi:MAG: hypothetical protein C0170_05425 [Hydrogenobaculum sp.]|nr:MAG: hypothetical protein C0170_05425 [Hydrogenobaculum sp.]
MKKVIVTVGTSIFENYLKIDKSNTNFKNAYFFFKDNKKTASDLDRESVRKRDIEKVFNESYFENGGENVCAEIKSLLAIKKELREGFDIYLISSDTAMGRLAAEIIKNAIRNYYPEFSDCELEIFKVSNLQVWDRKKFDDGMTELINTIYNIANSDWDNVVINISGGYKATIPYITMLGQINRCPIYYIFEDTDSLIKIPYIPIDLNWKIFEENFSFLKELEKEDIKELDKSFNHRSELFSLLEEVEDNGSSKFLYSLNPLGKALWLKFREKFHIFNLSTLAFEELEKLDHNSKDIIERSLLELHRRLYSNPSDPDLNHLLLDYGFRVFKHKEDNLQVRIAYKIDKYQSKITNGNVYDIYIGLFAVGSDVHNSGNEYVEDFKQKIDKVKDINEYKPYTITKGGR